MNNGDKPAGVLSCDPETCEHTSCTGLTKREAFAMAAMQGLLDVSHEIPISELVGQTIYEVYAKAAVEHADALLAALEEG